MAGGISDIPPVLLTKNKEYNRIHNCKMDDSYNYNREG